MNTPQEDWSSFLSVAGLKHPEDDRVFKAFEKARVTPSKLAASRDNWKSTLDGYRIPEGEIRVLIEAQLTKLSSAPPATVANPAPPQAPPAVVEFWNALPNAKLTEYKGKGKKKADGNKVEPTFLELATGTYFLGEEKFGPRLLVRECYKELAEVTFGIIESGSDLVITGNPGIGKSFFLFYFLYLLCVKDPDVTVVVYRHLEKQWYLFSKEGIFVEVEANGQAAFRKYLADPNTWYLVDTATPLEVKAKTLLLSSPYVQRYKEFRKTNARIRFMPVWSKEDIDICRREFYNNTVSQEQADELYGKWGGIPRYVLEKANRRDDQNELDVAISKCTTHDIMTYTGSEGTPEHISHKLLHMIVEKDPPTEGDEEPQVIDRYSTFHIDVASDYVAKRLTDKFGPEISHHQELLRTLQNRPGTAVLFGHLYENYAHQVIPRGGDFPTRNLTTGKVSTLHLKPKTTKQLRNVHDLSTIQKNEYGEGFNFFPGLDAAVSNPPNLFNMTATRVRQCGLNDDAVRDAFNNLPENTFPRPCRYNWVVPSNRFENFERQSVNGIRTKELDSMMEQFALELSISEPVQQPSGQSSKRKVRKEEADEQVEGVACEEILKSGRRKEKECGRINCSFHSKNKKRKK